MCPQRYELWMGQSLGAVWTKNVTVILWDDFSLQSCHITYANISHCTQMHAKYIVTLICRDDHKSAIGHKWSETACDERILCILAEATRKDFGHRCYSRALRCGGSGPTPSCEFSVLQKFVNLFLQDIVMIFLAGYHNIHNTVEMGKFVERFCGMM